MTLEQYLRKELTKVKHKLPRTKTIEEAISLFVVGTRKAGWNFKTASSYTNKFPEKQNNRTNHYLWLLESKDMKYCPNCGLVLSRAEFRNNSAKRDKKQTKCAICESNYQKDNAEKYAHYQALRRANKIKATPSWANMQEIKKIYKKCPIGYQVDHIVPLNGKTVCGLHVEYNLQYLTEEENMKKSNKFIVL